MLDGLKCLYNDAVVSRTVFHRSAAKTFLSHYHHPDVQCLFPLFSTPLFLASYSTLAFRTALPAKGREDILSSAPPAFRVLSGLRKVIAVSTDSLWCWWCVCSA